MSKLTAKSIDSKVTEINNTICWLEKEVPKLKLKSDDVHTKDRLILHRKSRKTKLADLANRVLNINHDETKLELDVMLYILKGCIDDYKKYSKAKEDIAENDSIRVFLPNLIIDKFSGLWKKLSKNNESTAVASNFQMITTLAKSGSVKEKDLLKDLTDTCKGLMEQYQIKQGELDEIKKFVENFFCKLEKKRNDRKKKANESSENFDLGSLFES